MLVTKMRAPIRLLRASRSGGFTLIELIVTMAVLVVGLSIAVPTYRDFIAATRVKNAAFDLTAMLTLARSEAIKRNAQVAVELGAAGWTVATPNSAGTIIEQREPFVGVTTTCKSGPSGCPADWPTGGVAYASTGRLAMTSSPAIDITTNGTTTRRCLSIDLSGLPKSATVACP